jgi:transcriptional regulator with XRE-family HTH domain
MGLFFDQDWFDDRLKAKGLTRAALAQASGMTLDEVEQVFHDQRELASDEVRAFARLLSRDASEIAARSGAADVGSDPGRSLAAGLGSGLGSGSEPGFVVTREVIAGLHERMDRLEKLIEMVLSRLDKLQR